MAESKAQPIPARIMISRTHHLLRNDAKGRVENVSRSFRQRATAKAECGNSEADHSLKAVPQARGARCD